ncbi:hypothetical protein [Parasitella parasitica]|uniref:Endonuclease/exonuclease/phosphatase domain-containing protein n=1 Tax=Parasitella parasitica TaxID=35722 RepID=A0A0B7N087_9FUNG|nr:hypothetical protein [Parasitella parasitica]
MHHLTLHNVDHAFGIPTYIRGTEANPTDKTSIIDFFLSTHPFDLEGISMTVNNDAYLGSDHKMVHFSLPHNFNPPPATNIHPRLLWNLNKFKQSKNHPNRHLHHIRQYRNHINPHLTDLLQRMDPIILSSTPGIDRQQAYIDSLNTNPIEIVHSSLDATIHRHTPRPKDWKWFYTQELADACHHRELLYKKWKHANQFNKILFWQQFQEAADKVRSIINKNKRFYFKQFCDKPLLLNSAKLPTRSKISNAVRVD